MKLSEISTERATEIICNIAPSVESIIKDSTLMETLQQKAKIPEGASATEVRKIAMNLGFAKMTTIINILLKQKKDDVFNILAELNEKTMEEIKKQNILVTVKQIMDIFNDKDLIDFFQSLSK